MAFTVMVEYLKDNQTKRIFLHLRLPQQIRPQIQITTIRNESKTIKLLKEKKEMKQQIWYKVLRNTLMAILM